jgi:hypothetical protein
MVTVALAFAVLQQGGSPTQVGAVLAESAVSHSSGG